MLTNIAVLRTVKENANKAVLDALPSILFEGSHNGKDAQTYLAKQQQKGCVIFGEAKSEQEPADTCHKLHIPLRRCKLEEK